MARLRAGARSFGLVTGPSPCTPKPRATVAKSMLGSVSVVPICAFSMPRLRRAAIAVKYMYSRFWAQRSTIGILREEQLLVAYLSSASGGPARARQEKLTAVFAHRQSISVVLNRRLHRSFVSTHRSRQMVSERRFGASA